MKEKQVHKKQFGWGYILFGILLIVVGACFIVIKDTFDKLGIPEAEQKYLAGVSTQFESEVVYHNTLVELEKQGVLFCDTDTGLRKYPELFKEYFGKIV